jgi:peptidoglycan/xylan/chitin deacetylase (PgdA/CDA1 family)
VIGVATSESDHEIVREFFELFKTPWEFCRAGRSYDVLLSPSAGTTSASAKLVVIYGCALCDFDREHRIDKGSDQAGRILVCHRERIPIYGSARSFNDDAENPLLADDSSAESLSVERNIDGTTVVRLGYDLFGEIRHLLTCGQPESFAHVPALERHISLLRRLIVDRGLLLVEIPPVPAAHPFIVALTHDVDHPRVRYHRFDHTMFGFVYRAVVGSFVDFIRGRRSLRQVRLNWQAAFFLPLVFAGVAKDFWDQYETYVDLEERVGSTFFVIPFKGEPGVNPEGLTRPDRASPYAAIELAGDLRRLAAADCEIGVHGIDAWRDSQRGEAERKCIQEITSAAELGVRMHWLYFNSGSPRKLEEAGFSYDSTVGYNATIGYRAGTTQVFKPVGVEQLLELPLHVMDTALFYPSYLNLSDADARSVMRPMIENAHSGGGVLTVNWHDRSLAPERLWGDAYKTLLDDLRAHKPWFATASKAVSWFRQRRTAAFGAIVNDSGAMRIEVSSARTVPEVPPLRLRIYNRRALNSTEAALGSGAFEEFSIEDSDQVLIAA